MAWNRRLRTPACGLNTYEGEPSVVIHLLVLCCDNCIGKASGSERVWAREGARADRVLHVAARRGQSCVDGRCAWLGVRACSRAFVRLTVPKCCAVMCELNKPCLWNLIHYSQLKQKRKKTGMLYICFKSFDTVLTR